MTLIDFVRKWERYDGTEAAGKQPHFIELCAAIGVESPLNDPKRYTFEKHVNKNLGGKGYADVWKRAHFGWEYKRPGGDLGKAYGQLLDYREDLENPPLLVVCDFQRFEVHTNFTATKKQIFTFTLEDLKKSPAEPLRILRAVFEKPKTLRPTDTREELSRSRRERLC